MNLLKRVVGAWRYAGVLAAMCVLTACQTMSPKPTAVEEDIADVVLFQLMTAEQKEKKAQAEKQLYRATDALLLRNTAMCASHVRPILGLRAQYEDMGTGKARTLKVTQVIKGTPARKTGLRAGDTLVALNDTPFPQGEKASEALGAFLSPFLAQAELKLAIARANKPIIYNLPLAQACAFRIDIGHTDAIDLYVNGHAIMLTQGMENFVKNGNERAYVVAKGMAHNLLGHAQQLEIADAVSMRMHALQQSRYYKTLPAFKPMTAEMDIEADRMALYLLQHAGYDVDGALEFWMRLAAHQVNHSPNAFTNAHPNTSARLAAIRKTLQEMKITYVPKRWRFY